MTARKPAVAPVRAGLTLMELIVVLVILIALATILVPLFPNMIGRAHKSSEATNINELTKAMQVYATLNNGSYPDRYDLLGSTSALAAYLPGNPVTATTAGGGTVGGFLNLQSLDANHAAALSEVGVKNVWPLFATRQTGPDFTPTFNPYDTAAANPTALSTSVSVAYVTAAGMKRAKIIDPTLVGSDTQFIVFGVGNRCALIGSGMANAPHLFADSEDENPANFYERFGVVFQVADVNGNPLTKAKFISAVSIEADGIEGVDADLEGFYQDNKQ